MVMVINRKVKRTMMEHKAPYIGSIFLIILSCLIFSLFDMVSINLEKNNQAFQEEYVQEDAHFSAQQPIENLSELEDQYHVRLEERLSFDEELGDGKVLRLFTPSEKINQLYVKEGETIRGEQDLLLDVNFATAHELEIGDTYEISGETFTITGFMMMPDYVYIVQSINEMIADSTQFGIGVLSQEAFDTLERGTPSYSVKFTEEADREEFKEAINEEYQLTDWLERDENPRITLVNQDIQTVGDMSWSMSVVILLITCTLIGIVIWRTLKREFVQIGTLYALGYKKNEILRHYLSYAWIVSLTGSVLGTICGVALVRPMLAFFTVYYNIPDIHTSWDIPVLLISLVLPSVFLVPVTWLIVKRALRMAPLELMRGGRTKNKVGFLEKHLHLGRLRFNNKFKIRELARNVPRTLLLLAGVVFASILLLFGFGIYNSMHYLVEDSTNVAQYEYNYLYNILQTEEEEDGEAYSVYPFSPAGKEKTVANTFTIYGIHPETDYLDFEDADGKKISLDETIITRALANKLGVKGGDTVRAVNALDDKTYTIEIDRVAEVYTGNNIYMANEELNEMLGFPDASHNGVFSDRKLSIDPDLLANATSKDEERKRMESILAPMRSVMGVLSAGAFAIGLIVIFVVTSLVIEENKETISMLKVFGYKRKEIYRLVLSSSTFVVIVGYLLAIPLLIQMLGALFRSMGESANYAMPVRISVWSFVIGFVIIFIAYWLAQWMGKRKVNKISLSEILKSRME
ncbi:ABC transporter permease [Bacillaceae bacterium Marseille-Q3522]|nr:ABC transporter permease [Bacillaceae bacterium Marseille-Q3522]